MGTVYDEAFNISTEHGTVVVKGPGEVAVYFTPNAAANTAIKLLEAAAAASGENLVYEANRLQKAALEKDRNE